MKYLQIIIRVFIILVAFLLNAVNVFGEVSSAFKPGNEDRILILNAYSGSSYGATTLSSLFIILISIKILLM